MTRTGAGGGNIGPAGFKDMQFGVGNTENASPLCVVLSRAVSDVQQPRSRTVLVPQVRRAVYEPHA